MLWSLSKMGLPQGLLPGPWLQETLWHFVEGTRGLRRLDAATPQDISNLLYALARLRFRPKAAWTRVMLMCMLPKLTAFNPQHLANTIWALSRLRVRPSQYWLLEFSTAVQSRLGGFSLIEARQVRDALALMTAAAVGSDSGRGEGSSHAGGLHQDDAGGIFDGPRMRRLQASMQAVIALEEARAAGWRGPAMEAAQALGLGLGWPPLLAAPPAVVGAAPARRGGVAAPTGEGSAAGGTRLTDLKRPTRPGA